MIGVLTFCRNRGARSAPSQSTVVTRDGRIQHSSRHQPEPTIRKFVGTAGIPDAGWVTTTLFPPAVSVVERDEVVVFGAAAIVTDPLPLPLLPLVMLSHEDDSEDVQAQPLVVVSAMLALPPTAAIERVAGETVKRHDAAACATVTTCPATVSVALRGLVAVFAVAA
jgi:hypothetical protein